MASKAAIAGVLAYLGELYPSREVTRATADAFHLAFMEWDDAELQRCATSAASEPGRKFFPTVGEITLHRRAIAVIDGSAFLRKIVALGTHNAFVGQIMPNVAQVRAKLGDDVADAFATAGPSRLFSNDETTRAIAEREFQRTLTEYANNPAPRVMVEAPEELKRLSMRSAKPASIAETVSQVHRQLTDGAVA